MDNLIYDRTQQDVIYALNNPSNQNFLKGAYNYTDLNRIETWCVYLAEILNSYSYQVSILTKTDWTIYDFPKASEMERIRKNIEALKNVYPSFSKIPRNLEYMTWQKANTIEKILYEIDKLIKNMIASFYYSNTFYSGESEGLM